VKVDVYCLIAETSDLPWIKSQLLCFSSPSYSETLVSVEHAPAVFESGFLNVFPDARRGEDEFSDFAPLH
jgi:hypothetical protein